MARVYTLAFLNGVQVLKMNSVPLRPVSKVQGVVLGWFSKVILFYHGDEFGREDFSL